MPHPLTIVRVSKYMGWGLSEFRHYSIDALNEWLTLIVSEMERESREYEAMRTQRTIL